jgi:5-methylcytosine-specific restriction endonuclease McrA
MRSYMRRWFAKASPEKKEHWNRMRRANQALHPETCRAKSKRFRDKIRDLTMTAYGGCCSCCGEDEQVFLTLDHIIPVHNRKRASGHRLYMQLRKQGWPKEYQLLCYNCNHAKGTNEACPHKNLVRKLLHGVTA